MLERGWSIYLKMLAVAPLVGIAYLWSYLRGSGISLMALIGACPQILVAIGLIGFGALAYSVLTTFAGIFLPHRYGVSRAILEAMQQRSLVRGWPQRCRGTKAPFYWIAAMLAVPSFAGMVAAQYGSARYGFWWLLMIGVMPSVAAWVLLAKSGFGERKMTFYALFSMLFTAFSTVCIAFLLFLTIKSCFRYVYYVPEKRGAHLLELVGYHGGLIALMAVLSCVVAWIFAPTRKSDTVIKVKLSAVIVMVIATSFLGFAPFHIVQEAFGVFANGGEYRIYSSMTGKALTIPASSCIDPQCMTSTELHIAADFGNNVYVWLAFPLPNRKEHELLLRRIDTTGTTYKVTKTDPISISDLRIL